MAYEPQDVRAAFLVMLQVRVALRLWPLMPPDLPVVLVGEHWPPEALPALAA
jgi:hypothetical protein